MPGFQIHLAVAKRYIEKHKIKEQQSFLEGSIEPDFVKPKEKSHYTMPSDRENLIEHVKAKVNLTKFLAENEIKTDYDKGILLHLLTDKIFFEEFFDTEYLKSVNYQQFCEDLYYSYGASNAYIEKKYQLVLTKEMAEKINQNIQNNSKEKHLTEQNVRNILPTEKLDAFIEKVSNIDLEEYTKKTV